MNMNCEFCDHYKKGNNVTYCELCGLQRSPDDFCSSYENKDKKLCFIHAEDVRYMTAEKVRENADSILLSCKYW